METSQPESAAVPVFAQAVEDMSEADVYELMYHMKTFCEVKPEEAAQMLNEHVEFARALAQVQLRLNMNQDDTPSTVRPEQSTKGLNLDPEHQKLLEELQNLAPEVIQGLPFEQRKQIMELREAMGLPPV
ncbi:hypothetical protein H257_05448 [Aphanomyces astaci]|uniref:Cleavage stimulation factor subunit 2 hinge domain-containing protein n=1 Tax=Aphanomyces astaci TaxID=112090 RepID=W4GSA6_APHAT|nr:hypothetical protein H257_05448 [Aphanomyces astaci]ETV81904.1 hypothetical protein H257_05448 [Aphanomyces astaci]RHY02457.1 hypothetical protein DYB25_012248 [Aphanomyces astaci]RHY05037.1 hypothetical protein DYB36_009772 [Aphanomyces astaci]RHY45792.1 hypothetical protein DYB30_012308 [Aphanomyces astaci]RHZ02527.1 hypothetical protein DYB35_005316 [Aphanomyces astaci]|eukprot:XP_009828641.1 hypothetical protein H257_05448 [Aphanomyces astaci]